MTRWKKVFDKEKYGIVIYNFDLNQPQCLKLNLGETVQILEEIEGWYYGFSTKTRSKLGIFPKNYIHIKEAVFNANSFPEVLLPKEAPIVQELTSILREWGVLWKQLYVHTSAQKTENFDRMRGMIYELIDCRRCILSGTLPADELKELKRKVTALIDVGNSILGLDLIVRDEKGNILDPDKTSTIQLYRQHVQSTQRLQREEIFKDPNPVTRYSHSLFVTLKNFVCKIGEDADLLMTLYDAKEAKFFSENYVVKWAKEGLARDLDQLNNLRALFTDLGTKDLLREKVFLVCQIIRIGAMELKEVDHKRMTYYSKKSADELRRPFGVAAMDVSDFISGKLESDEEKQHFVPFIQCGEKDFLDSMIRKVISLKEVAQKDHKGQGLWVSVKLLHGDMKQVREEYPHLVSVTTAIARKMGFPEIILPGDVRNDLYLTLVQGEFPKGNKSCDKNVEATVRVCNEKGQTLQNCISVGAGCGLSDSYRSVIYYHEDKPKWCETFKITIPIDEFSNAHLKFTFRHRSSNDVKDKSEKPFALSFVKLRQENGTTLKDECHELIVYKVDHKKFNDDEVTYLSLPSTRQELEVFRLAENSGRNTFNGGGLTLSNKDNFQISTLVCSTKLTQNVDLLGLLKWSDNQEGLKDNLLSLMKVDGEEVVKFLQDVLDALFNILMLNNDSDLYDNLVFEALVFIIGLISDRKYQHFRPVLDLYIRETFSATLAYNKLMVVLKCLVDNANEKDGQDALLRTMKSLEYIFKFIIRSRRLFSQLNEGKGKQQFEALLKQLLQSFTGMMLYTTDVTLLVQGACLKFIPTIITDVLQVFDGEEFSHILNDLIEKVPPDRLTKQKMMCVNDIVHSDLFKKPECRFILLREFCHHIRCLLECDEEIELCVKILSDIMEVLHGNDVGDTCNDITEIMMSSLRTIIQTVIQMDRSSALVGNFVAVMIAILREMTQYHYQKYVEIFAHRSDLLDFLMEILLVFKDLVNKNVYLPDWNQMIMLQNRVVLKALCFISNTIRDVFCNPFEYQVWSNFFHCAISFLTQEVLQLENFSQNKRNKISSRYKDMRRETAFEIRSMWFSLGQHKIQFVPGMVGPFLEMTLVPEQELRKATIPIFFDMMQCEFYSTPNSISVNENHPENCYHSSYKHAKGNFYQFEDEMITQLDMLIEGGRGDEQYKNLFSRILTDFCENHSTMKEQGLNFVRTVVQLIERLLEYRTNVTSENRESRMSCTVNLLEFYNGIKRREMYLRYLYKLCDLHLECDNFTEAAFTLMLHAKLLKWSNDPLQQILKNAKFPNCESHRELKETLYYTMIEYFDKGKMWEIGLSLLKELCEQYENELWDFKQLSEVLKKMSDFYLNILNQLRPESEYFRVGYYGLGFPPFLQNKVFIYRGKEYERLSDFTSHLQNLFPNAQLMTKLTPPTEEMMNSSLQYLQINKVDPIMEEKKKFADKHIDEQILKYYRVNDVQKFTYSRRKGGRESDNEFANLWLEKYVLEISCPLPGILRWFPVVSIHSYDVSPLENAIDAMEATNKKLKNLIDDHHNDPNLPINPLSMTLQGVVDAAVMGGIANYERAFFTDDYLEKNPTRKAKEGVNRLKDLIARQIPLLELGLALHRQKAPENLHPFQEHLEECFIKLKAQVEEKYGTRPLDLYDVKRTNRRIRTMPPKMTGDPLDGFNGNSSFTDLTVKNFTLTRRLSSATSKSTLSLNPRAQSVFVRQPGSPSTLTLRKDKRDGTLRRSSTTSINSRESEGQSQSQWYDSKPDLSQQPIIELKEQLTPHRPLRSEITERRNSRPPSGQFFVRVTQSPTRSAVSLMPMSTMSPTSDQPPPLPQKQAYADYGNISEMDGSCIVRKGSLPLPYKTKKPPFPLPTRMKTPPTPPRKPRRPNTAVGGSTEFLNQTTERQQTPQLPLSSPNSNDLDGNLQEKLDDRS